MIVSDKKVKKQIILTFSSSWVSDGPDRLQVDSQTERRSAGQRALRGLRLRRPP
jgi:hypothetical protein